VGVDPRERGARTDEGMRVLRALFAGPGASFSGRFYAFEGITIEPQPVQAGGPPLWVGGGSEAARRRTGRLGDGSRPLWVSPERFAEGLAEVRRHADETGRDPGTIAAAVMCPALVGEGSRERLATHLEERYSIEVKPHLIDRYCIAGSEEECAA